MATSRDHTLARVSGALFTYRAVHAYSLGRFTSLRTWQSEHNIDTANLRPIRLRFAGFQQDSYQKSAFINTTYLQRRRVRNELNYLDN